MDEHTRPLRRDRLAAQARPLAAEVAHDVDGAAHLGARLRQGLALLAGHLARDAVGARLEQLGRLEEDLTALGRRDRRPLGLRLPRGIDGTTGVFLARAREQSDDVAGVGRVHILEGLARKSADPLSADEIPEGFSHARILPSRRGKCH
jgi:hypothetical protein